MNSEQTPQEARLQQAIEDAYANNMFEQYSVPAIIVPSIADVTLSGIFLSGTIPNPKHPQQEKNITLFQVFGGQHSGVTGIFERLYGTSFDAQTEKAQIRPNGCYSRLGTSDERIRDAEVEKYRWIIELTEWDVAYSGLYAGRYSGKQFPSRYEPPVKLDPDE